MLEIFSRSFNESQVEPGVTKEWRTGSSKMPSAKTMQPDPETQIMQPGEALKALEILSCSMEEGQVEAGVAEAPFTWPS